MARRLIYTRVYSKSSAATLVSGKGPNGDPLSDEELLGEFRNHAEKWNQEPTALISLSDRIVDTVKRAFDRHYRDGESPPDIWLAFIKVPATMHETAGGLHAAARLANDCRLSEPGAFKHEFVYEWAIPKKYVLHKVSLEILMDRGLGRGNGFIPSGHKLQSLSTGDLRRYIATELQPDSSGDDPWEIGVALAFFAQNFGARAPSGWIAHQLFYDCVWTRIIDEDVVRLSYANEYSRTVTFDYFHELDDGIETGLVDWWLTDTLNYEEFEEWRGAMEDSMVWDMLEFWESWHDVECDADCDVDHDELLDIIRNELSGKHDEIRAAIEAVAVAIGL